MYFCTQIPNLSIQWYCSSKVNRRVFFAVDVKHPITQEAESKLSWLFGNAELINQATLIGYFVGPRREMITPWEYQCR